jgi:hypothetical protein
MRGLIAMYGAGLALALAGGASAQEAKTFDVVGSVPQICTVQEPTISAAGPLLNFRSLNGTTLQVDQLVDSQTMTTRAASVDVSFEATCNLPHRIVLESQNNGLWRNVTGAPPSGFADGVPYTATLTWGLINSRFEVDASSRRTSEQSVLVDEATAGEILIRLAIQPGASNLRANAPLIAGTYQDTLRVTVEPQ